MGANRFSHPESVVETDWLHEHLEDPEIRIIESNENPLLYGTGHIPGAIHVGWRDDLQDPIIRDYASADSFCALCERHGIAPDTTCVFYGDKANWWACYALWAFRLLGHEKVKVLNGGRDKWVRERRPITRETPRHPRAHYPISARRCDGEIRAFFEDAMSFSRAGGHLIDVRTPGEFCGELTHMPNYPQEGTLRGGHIPGARNVPWEVAVNSDGTFKSVYELRKIYLEQVGLRPIREVIVYCRIGERSSHTWFVLTYLLGFDAVRNYDGSWMEWGNRVQVPIERGR